MYLRRENLRDLRVYATTSLRDLRETRLRDLQETRLRDLQEPHFNYLTKPKPYLLFYKETRHRSYPELAHNEALEYTRSQR